MNKKKQKRRKNKKLLKKIIRKLFKLNSMELIDLDKSNTGSLRRIRAKRYKLFDEMIAKILSMVLDSPFDFKVYTDSEDKLSIIMRIYEPGKKEDLDEKS